MNTRLVVAVAMLPIFGCAKRPDAIVPTNIPMAAYTNLSCEEIAREIITEQATLTALSKQQNEAATGDAVGVFLIGVPMSSTFGGDKEGQLAVSKGKLQAMQSAATSKNCNAPPPPAPPAKKA